jgi:hypothetical protein
VLSCWVALQASGAAWLASCIGACRGVLVSSLALTLLPVLAGCRCYLVQRQRAEQLGRSAPDFTKWVEDRRELGHLMHHLNLDT